MGKIVGWVVGTFLLFWVGLGAGIAWEHRPHNWPNITIPIPFWNPKVGFGDGLAAQAANARAEIDDPKTGWKVRLDQCHANGRTLETAIKVQNASITAAKAAGDKMAADAAKAVQQAHSETVRLQARGSALVSKPLTGGDVCSRAVEAFERVKADLK